MSPDTIDFWTRRSVRYWNPGNSGYTELKFMADSLGGNQLQLAFRGAVLHNVNPAFTGGGVNLGTTVPNPTGGVPGSIWLVY